MLLVDFKRISLSAAIIMLSMGIKAQTSNINIVNSAVPFLQVTPDARAGGMGDVGVATSADANSIFWNAAKTVFASQNAGLSMTYTPWMKDVAENVYFMNAAGYYKPDENSALMGGIRYFNLGNLQFVDVNGNLLGSQKPKEFSIEGAYARKISQSWSVGLNFKYINSSLVKDNVNGASYKTGTAFASDVSVFYNGLNANDAGLTGGLTLSNIGTKISYVDQTNQKSFLPANLAVGLAYKSNIDEKSNVTLAMDANHLMVPAYKGESYFDKSVISGMTSSFGNKAYALAAGVEYSYDKQLFLRGGYHWETKEAGNNKFFSAGVGLKYTIAQVNFSYLMQNGNGINKNPLSNTLRFSLVFDL